MVLGVALAIDSDSGEIYVSSGSGVEIFNPTTQEFSHFSRDLDLRVGSLAFDSAGTLWATTWPDRSQVVRFNERARAETMFAFEEPVDSLAFGPPGSDLDGLLFVSHNTGQLTLIDVDTLCAVRLAEGGSRGDVIYATQDGRVLLSQSDQVDILNPATPPIVVATNPPLDGVAALPLSAISIVFDQPMYVGQRDHPASAINVDNYHLVGDTVGEVTLQDVRYDADSLTTLLIPRQLQPDHYVLTVDESISTVDGLSLIQPYETSFTAVTDVTAMIELQITSTRSSRVEETITYDVAIVNRADRDLVLPVVLSLESAPETFGFPIGAVEQAQDGRWLIDLSEALPEDGRLAPGQSTSGRPLRLRNPNMRRADYGHTVSANLAANLAPLFDSQPVTNAAIGQPYSYPIQAHDPDGVALVYLLLSGPEGMMLDPLTGALTWLPTAGSPATSEVVVGIYDGLGAQAQQPFTLLLDGGNRAPVLATLPDVIEGVEGGLVEIHVLRRRSGRR